MSEVFPTDCSPRNTSLNFLSGLPKSPEVDMVTSPHFYQHLPQSVSGRSEIQILSPQSQSLVFESLLKHTRLDRRRGRPQRSRRHRIEIRTRDEGR